MVFVGEHEHETRHESDATCTSGIFRLLTKQIHETLNLSCSRSFFFVCLFGNAGVCL